MKIVKIIIFIVLVGSVTFILWWYRDCIDWLTVFTAIGALGTIFIAILAIWGEAIRAKCYGPKLKLEPHNFKGTLAPITEIDTRTGKIIDQYQGYYYHLKVVNSRPFVSAKNCRVMLKQIYLRGPDGEFHPERLLVPLQYIWAPSEWSPALQTVAKEEVLDFGRISPNDKFRPTLYHISGDFRGFVEKDQALRYSLQIVADNFVSPKYQVFEVSWNGKWSQNTDEMANNLLISKINPQTS